MESNETFTKMLKALIASDFVVKYVPFGMKKTEVHYKLVDPFCWFWLHFVKGQTRLVTDFWECVDVDGVGVGPVIAGGGMLEEGAVLEFTIVAGGIVGSTPGFDAHKGTAAMLGGPEGQDGHDVTKGDEGTVLLVEEGDLAVEASGVEQCVALESGVGEGQQILGMEWR